MARGREDILQEPEQAEAQPRPPAPHPAARWMAAALLLALGGAVVLYARSSTWIDRQLDSGSLINTASMYAAPETVALGQRATAAGIAAVLRRSGYSERDGNPTGRYRAGRGWIEIHPGRQSCYPGESAVIRFAGGRVAEIRAVPGGTALTSYRLEPQLISSIDGHSRDKRRLVSFDELPKALVAAVVSAEDKRFFEHRGIDPRRVLKAAWVDLKEGSKQQGASTITMQLARSLWLDRDKSWRRKAREALIALQLEQKLSKKDIFEHYANHVYLGRRGTFNIRGFGEAARVFFDREVAQLTLPQAATLAGMLQRPGYWNPLRCPERARERRNLVLSAMFENGYLDPATYRRSAASPLGVKPGDEDSTDAPYFLDLVDDELQSVARGQVEETGAERVYTTLDLRLQRAAEEAVRNGMRAVDAQLKRRRNYHPPGPQVALIALDPHTGAVKALTGGRSYAASQLNRVRARRQPGSVFKPFVYTAALNTAVAGGPRLFTPSSSVIDEPTTFWFNGQPYEPANFGRSFHGSVTLRRALARSLNVATVRLAEQVGYQAVAELARSAGLGDDILPTPAVALGAYETTPLRVAAAYTVYANQGVQVEPWLVSTVQAGDGTLLYTAQPHSRRVLDPRVAYLMVDMLEEVIRSGSGAGVRARGFHAPAAGKTGTSRDGWFAGFTSNLLCVVWVGYDDNRDLNLEGARSALPIWTEFMKRAASLPGYRDPQPFAMPSGVERAIVDPTTGLLANAYCPSKEAALFISGTQPFGYCPAHHAPEPVLPFDLAAGDPAAPEPEPALEEPEQ